MEHSQIKAFLDIIEYGTISKAAEKNYTSQGHISNLIKTLEDELGVKLMERKKGVRYIELTPHGEKFLDLAEQYILLWSELKKIGSTPSKTRLSIGGIDIIPHLFEQLFLNHIHKHPDISLELHTYHSRELAAKLHNRSLDLAYVYNPVHFPDVITTPIFTEPMYLVCNKENGFFDDMDLTLLPKEKEIYLRWSNEYEQWHSKYFGKNNYLIRIAGGHLISTFLRQPGSWTIGPAGICNFLKDSEDFAVFSVAGNPPRTTCYQLENKYSRPSHETAIRMFKKELYEFLESENSWALATQIKKSIESSKT